MKRSENLLKPCPKCQKPNQIETRICICGFWFIKPELSQQTSNLQQSKREKLKRTAKKSLILAGFVVLCGALAAFLSGFIELPRSSESENETSSLANNGVTSDTQKASTNSRTVKGTIEGTVIAVSSGDTITVLDKNNQKYEIKLGGIDTPKPEQDFGVQAKENLETLILNKAVSVNLQKVEDSGLFVGKVLFDGRNINLEQIKAGFAWHNKDNANLQTEDDRQLYADAETTAKTAKIGLWSNVNQISPSEVSENTTVNPSTDAKKTEPNSSAQIETLEAQTTPQSKTTSTDNIATPAPLPSPSLIVNQPTPQINPPTTSSNETKTTVTSNAATARCGDGTLSYSVSRSGACSNHGGVASWLNGSNSTIKPDISGKKTYVLGSRGGCYYINSNGKKTYVDQSLCK